jgi:hypothetical protein
LADGLSPKVDARLQELFSGEDQATARALLLEYRSSSADGNDRIWLDILRICEERLDRVRLLVELAKTDYRDLILAAEYDDMGGKYVLKPGLTERWWTR